MKKNKEIQRLRVTDSFIAGGTKVVVNVNLITEVAIMENGEVQIFYKSNVNDMAYSSPCIKTDAKLVWQKVQQQQGKAKINERKEEPFEDDGAYAD